MNLIDLIKYLREPEKLEELFRDKHSNLDYDFIEVYSKEKICAYSNLLFISDENLEFGLEYLDNNNKYINLFPLYLLVELFDDFKRFYKSDLEIANRLIDYRINDA